MDRQPVTLSAAPAKATVVDTTIKPIIPPATAQEGVAIESFSTPIHPGDTASIYISTNPTSTCTIDVEFNHVPDKDPALAPKTADNFGGANWQWTVAHDAPLGDWPVTVTCTFHGRSGVVADKLSVFESPTP